MSANPPPHGNRSRREPRGDNQAFTSWRSWNRGACSSPREIADFATVATETAVAVLTDESIARNPTLNVPETHEMTRAIAEPILSNLEQVGLKVPSLSLLPVSFPQAISISPIKIDNLTLQL